MNKTLIILFLFFAPQQLLSQVLPKEGNQLTYRLIGFSFPSRPGSYKIEIAAGNYYTVDSFRKNIIETTESKTNKLIAEVPAFGSQYTWRVVYSSEKKEENKLYHFSTGMNPNIDTSKLHLRILHPADAYKDAYVSVDAGGVLYDMSGHPVWYIPEADGITGNLADMQFTPGGTITFLCMNAYEINFFGEILWKAPNDGTVNGDKHGEFYHHEFTKLPNGHYMVLGTQKLQCKPASINDSSFIIFSKERNEKDAREQNGRDVREQNGKDGYKNARIGTIIEYDEKGGVAWSWDASKYLSAADFNNFNAATQTFDPHENAFFFDEKNSCIYLGFRNLNRIIKIEYPSGKVLRTYGQTFKPGPYSKGDGLFCNQHSIGRTQDGYLYIFNNNSCNNTDSLPTIMMLKEPVSEKGNLEKIWEYTCTIENDAPKKFTSGGNAVELPGHSFFVNMGSEYSKLFIVNRDKKILWSAIPEEYIYSDAKWKPIHEYRANIISREGLEKLIWAAETTK